MKTRNYFVGVGMVGMLLFVFAFSSRQRADILDDRKVSLNLEDGTVAGALTTALTQTGIPGGIVVNSRCGEPLKHSFQISNLSLRGALDIITTADPEYFWEFKNGVVNFLPRVNQPTFLRTTISNFEISDISDPNEALNQLLLIPEVRDQVKTEFGSRIITGGPYAYSENVPRPARKKFSVAISGATVGDVLNSIALAQGSAIWRFSKTDCSSNSGRRYFSLNFIGINRSNAGAPK